jgi:hypothetical protein
MNYDTSAFDTRLVYQDVRSEQRSGSSASTISYVQDLSITQTDPDDAGEEAGSVARQTDTETLWFLVPIVLLVFAAVVSALFEPATQPTSTLGHPSVVPADRARPPRGLIRTAAGVLFHRRR